MLKRGDVVIVFVCLIFVHFLVTLYTLYTVSEGTGSTMHRGYLSVLHDSIRFPSLSLRSVAYYSNADSNIGSLPTSNLIATVIQSPYDVDAAIVLGYSLRQFVSCLDHVNDVNVDPEVDQTSLGTGSSGSSSWKADPTPQEQRQKSASPSSRVYCVSRAYYNPLTVNVRSLHSSIRNDSVDLTVKLQQAGWMEVIPLNFSAVLDAAASSARNNNNDLFTSLFLEFEDRRFHFRQMLYLSPRSFAQTDLSELFDSEKSLGRLLPHYSAGAALPGDDISSLGAGSGALKTPELTVLCLTASDFYLDGSDEPVLFMAVPIPGLHRQHQPSLKFTCRGNLATAERFAPKILVELSKASRRAAQLQRKAKLRDYDWLRHVGSGVPLGFFNEHEFRSVLESIALTNVLTVADDVVQRQWCALYEAAAAHALTRTSRSMFWRGAQLWSAKTDSLDGQLVGIGTAAESLLPSLATVESLQNLTSPQMRLVLGRPGESCLQTCATIDHGCAPKALQWWLPGSCAMLRRLFTECDKCTVDLSGKGVAPAYRQSDNLCLSRYPRSPARSACNASLPGYSRACTCFETKAQFSAVVRPLGADDMLDLLDAAGGADRGIGKKTMEMLGKKSSRVEAPGGGDLLDPVPPLSKQGGEDLAAKEEAEFGPCPCPVASSYGATEEAEWACLTYISNFSNVIAIKPMLANVKFGRTAKFEITYARSCVRGIAKPPQKSFPLEPYAEYVAFEIDRLLDLRYVPPTTWLFLPLMQIELSAEKFSNGVTASGEEAARAARAYATWLAEEVMEYSIQRRLTAIDPLTHKMVLGCSIQVWVDGARWHRGTPLEYDDGYISLLTLESARLLKERRLFSAPAVQQSILNTPAKIKNVEQVLPYLSDTVIFDTILANDDRSSQKNSHVYRNKLIEGSRGGIKGGGSSGSYKYLHLDQGKSFYVQRVVSKFTLNDLDDDVAKDTVGFQSVCMFRAGTVNRLRPLANGGLLRRLTDLVPEPIRKQFSNNQLHWAQARVDAIQRHVDTCSKLLGPSAAFPWA